MLRTNIAGVSNAVATDLAPPSRYCLKHHCKHYTRHNHRLTYSWYEVRDAAETAMDLRKETCNALVGPATKADAVSKATAAARQDAKRVLNERILVDALKTELQYWGGKEFSCVTTNQTQN